MSGFGTSVVNDDPSFKMHAFMEEKEGMQRNTE